MVAEAINNYYMSESINTKVKSATKWSAITEIIAKLITPITSMVLARLLTPEAFGVVATLTMIISFAEIFTDAGFQKYLIQHDFKDEKDQIDSTNVAFWSNLIMSLIIWLIIIVFSAPLAKVVGNTGLGHVISVSCVSIPIAAFSSIQMALYRRNLDFKTLFKTRMVGIVMPLFITIPLALLMKNYWALIIGSISKEVVNAFLLTWYSKWKPQLYYSFDKLREMLSFTIWSMFEAISIWLTSYVDVFIIGTVLSSYYLGLYKTSSTLVGQVMGLITAATTPILFSSLSRLQNNEEDFTKLFFNFQHAVSLLVIPFGIGLYCYSDFVTNVCFGDQWNEASGFVGLWGLTSALTIVLSHYSSEVYRAKGKPKLSIIAQWLHIVVLWPTVILSTKYGFETLYVSRSLVRLELVLVNLIIMNYVIHISPLKMISNISKPLIAAMVMGVVGLLTRNVYDSIVWQIFTIILCVVTYFGIVLSFKNERAAFLQIIKNRKK